MILCYFNRQGTGTLRCWELKLEEKFLWGCRKFGCTNLLVIFDLEKNNWGGRLSLKSWQPCYFIKKVSNSTNCDRQFTEVGNL